MLKRVCVNKSSLSVSGLRCSTGVLSKSAVAVNCRSIHTSWKGCTFQYQKSLPRLPIPDLTKVYFIVLSLFSHPQDYFFFY